MHLLLLLICAAAMSLCQLSEKELDARLARIHAEIPDFDQRVAAIARCSLGTPYANGPLGEGPGGVFDTDPLVDHTRADCVTFIEQTLAFAAVPDYARAVDLLQKIRYRKGRIAYQHRNHFMVADWLEANPWCRDVTAGLGAPALKITRTISKAGFYERVGFTPTEKTAPDREITIQCLPPQHCAAAEARFPSPAIILFIGHKPDWLFTLHTGIYLRENGEGRLYHASSADGKAVAADLCEYLNQKSERYAGILVCATENPAS
jgi:hypothetical protein